MIFKRIIKTNIPDADKRISKLLCETSVQLSDGYWENEEHWFEEYWNWLEFSDTNGYLTIGILAIPAWDNVKNIFENMSDNEVIKYVADVLDSCWSCAGNDVYKEYSDIIENVIKLLETVDEPKKQKKLTRKVNVSDPECWYGKKTINVEMCTLPTEPNTVRILFKSSDDFIVYFDFKEWRQEANWNWCKTWLWDNIPDTVDLTWLYQHGYRNF